MAIMVKSISMPAILIATTAFITWPYSVDCTVIILTARKMFTPSFTTLLRLVRKEKQSWLRKVLWRGEGG